MNAKLVLPLLSVLVCGCSRGVLAPGPQPMPSPQQSRGEPQATDEPARARGNSESVHVLGVPPGHLPRAGLCRVWVQGVPPGRQARSRACYGITATAPLGSWILYRPRSNRNIIHVHVMDERRPGVVAEVRVFDLGGRYLRSEQGDDHRDDDDDFRDKQGGGRGRSRDRGRPGN